MGKRKVITESEIERRLPQDFEGLGRAEKLLGYDRIMVKCQDGITRLCRIKGKMKRRAWIRVDDIVIVSPWDFQSDTRGDIVYRYKPNQLGWLRSKSSPENNFFS